MSMKIRFFDKYNFSIMAKTEKYQVSILKFNIIKPHFKIIGTLDW